jgi:general L-amino acid transport system substrate-binding protein
MMTVVRHVGNFGELFERTLGVASPYRLERGANALKRDGGLLGATED